MSHHEVNDDDIRCLDLAGAAEFLSQSKRTVRAWCKRGKETDGREGLWPFSQPTARIFLIPKASLKKFLEATRPTVQAKSNRAPKEGKPARGAGPTGLPTGSAAGSSGQMARPGQLPEDLPRDESGPEHGTAKKPGSTTTECG